MIKALTQELYRAQQRVHRLQDRLAEAPLGGREQLRRELREAEAACSQLRRLLEGRKETAAAFRPRR